MAGSPITSKPAAFRLLAKDLALEMMAFWYSSLNWFISYAAISIPSWVPRWWLETLPGKVRVSMVFHRPYFRSSSL